MRDGLVGFAPNPPLCALPALPLTAFSPLAAKRVWLLLNLGFLGSTFWLLHRITQLSWRRVILILLLCAAPLQGNFLGGQYYVLLLLLISGAYYASCLGHRFTSGLLLAVAAVLKLFPALFLVLFIWKRDWRSAAGLVVGAIGLTAVSVYVFGAEVHRAFVVEVLPQAFRGDWLAPYDLQRNSFITLWSHLFLVEPELNPRPLLSSPLLYAFAQAATTTVLILALLWACRRDKMKRPAALEWAACVPMLLLLSSTTGISHPAVLVFTGVVGFAALFSGASQRRAWVFLFLYAIACAPIPPVISKWFPLSQLAAITLLYVLLLHAMSVGNTMRLNARWVAAGVILGALFSISNLRLIQDRSEDFSSRLPSPTDGSRAANPVAVAGGTAFTEMLRRAYQPVVLKRGDLRYVPIPGDVLSISGTASGPFLYAEMTSRQSSIMRLTIEPFGLAPQTITEGQEPAVSSNGKWLAFVREDQGKGSVWLLAVDSNDAPQEIVSSAYRPLDIAVTSEGQVVAAVGSASDPYLVLGDRATTAVRPIVGVSGPARYPSVSPDGKRLAFSRRAGGFWHMVVRDLATGAEQQLTHAPCNAISASWQDTRTLLYATDCGRGVGLSAIARVVVPN